MNKEIIIAVNVDCSNLFFDFAKEYPESVIAVKVNPLIDISEFQEFIINITPHLLTALTAYLVARIQNLKKEIKIKKGNIEIEIKNTNITPDTVLSLLEKLEQ